MSEITKNSLESSLRQLKCHFTWNLIERENSVDDFEDRVCNQIEFQNSEFKATTYNILAYIKHLRGQNKAALEYLQQAEELIQLEHTDQAEIRSLVTWGNYAWVYYHMDRLSEAHSYLDKVKQVCQKFSSPYRINNSPEIDCEEGWTRLKCGGKFNERAKVCFEKALEKKPKNPEFSSGLAIASYRLDKWPPNQNPINPLRQAIRLNPDNQYVKVLLALKLQELNEEGEGENIVEEALEKAPHATDVLRSAAKFYRKKGALDKAIEMLGKTLECMPNNAYLHYYTGCCYRAKVLQIQCERYENKDKLPELIEQGVDHLKQADELNMNLSNVCSYLACLYAHANQYEEADHYFQKEFSKELNPVLKQRLHLRYGNFQLYQMRCEEKAIHHFMEGVKINQGTKEKEKMKNKLQRIAKMRLSQNEADSEALRILRVLDELNGEMQQAVEDSKRCLGSASLLPSASIAEIGDGE
ncbi:interferon-induced protein with tetratricopeptide repeats 2 [Trichechus manatus latirostris]|uniref:Interferon-induced protein with tetratricopeptide repeats 2 n=1 Tax=Trichechus manatus latirostris TaxID=127582 RepID=A0A2Y9FZ19_TRIMA|nr:interferon-induced protein with tetratricopeptide repeats 2 [Trichechus manatus latirostris]